VSQIYYKNIVYLLSILTICFAILITTGCQESSTDTSNNEIPIDDTSEGSGSGAVSLSWSPPTTRSDGTTLSNLTGYRIYYGTTQGNYSNSVDINNAGITEYILENLTPNTYYFVITAYDSQGVESDFSNVVSKTI
jgi:hypothetical protein